MKISIDNEQILELTEIQKKVIKNDIHEEIFDSDMKRRLKYIVDHPCERCIEHHKKQWLQELKEKGAVAVSVTPFGFAELVLQDTKLDPQEDKESSVIVDGKEEFKITKTHKKLLKFQKQKPDEFAKSQMKWILTHKYERCMERLRKEWEPKLASRGNTLIPIDDDAFAELVFSQSDYKNRSQRDAESQSLRG